MSVRATLAEAITTHRLVSSSAERDARIEELMHTVGLSPAFADRYPHEFSGGQRQRIGFARALAVEPEFIVCDEPVSALDVSIQAQILNLLKSLQTRLNLTYLFIAHDLAVVRHVSDAVAVMYLGRLVEVAEKKALYESAFHPYTKALLSAVPVSDPLVEMRRQRIVLTGDVPSPVNPPSGCYFHPRCPWAVERCTREQPVMEQAEASDAGRAHTVVCHRWREIAQGAPTTTGQALEPGGV
jgi:oligopeptide transport system ATP-binding protein